MKYQQVNNPGGTTYYIDVENGDDNNSGLTTKDAWLTQDRLEAELYGKRYTDKVSVQYVHEIPYEFKLDKYAGYLEIK